MSWFARDHTGRQLSASEQAFLTSLGQLLSDIRPAQIDESETVLTAERDECLIVLLPHRALAGVSIGIWLTEISGDLFLAQVGGLGVSHDSLDLGVAVAGVKLDPVRPDFEPLLARIREQLFAPMTVRVYGESQATVWVRNIRGKLWQVGDIGKPLGRWQRWFGPAPSKEMEIRFVDSEPPPIKEPSGVDEWFVHR